MTQTGQHVQGRSAFADKHIDLVILAEMTDQDLERRGLRSRLSSQVLARELPTSSSSRKAHTRRLTRSSYKGKPEVALRVRFRARCTAISAGISRMIERAAAAARLGIKAHAHMLRHACGYKLANDGIDTRSLQAYLGPRNIANTVRYTALAPDRIKIFFRD